ncbi:MAG: tyrosine-protein phosphatase [Treponema sp.]|jgi:protein-tyrosine phosphatase|nr:tyrosine-protein phosphatase [Treponema sp.]
MDQQRLLVLEKAHNVRELGGYLLTAFGSGQRHVKWGRIYRSGDLFGLSAADKKCLEDRRIKTIVDFRAPEEKQAAPDDRIATVDRVAELPIDAGNLMGSLSPSGGWAFNPSPEGAAAEMITLYSVLPREAIPLYRELFALLAESANTPLLFHCSAGKDRTGLASALLLHALGAARDVIMEDYLASTKHLRPVYAIHEKTRPYMIPYMTVREEYLLAALAEIDNYGGLDRYITRELKADPHRLRELYTE